MAKPDGHAPSSPFGPHDYQFDYQRLEHGREVAIQSRSARPLVVGEVCTFSRENGFYDAVVTEISRDDDGDWRACCRVIDLQWF